MSKTRQMCFPYAYMIIVSIAVQRFIVCAETTSSGLFLIPVTSALNISQGTYMLYQTIEYGIMAVMSAIIPKLTTKFKYTSLNKVGLVFLTCGLLCMSTAKNVYMFYLAGVLNGLGLVVCNLLLMGSLVPRWFSGGMGIVMAVITLLFTLPGMLLTPVVSYLIGRPTVLGIESWRGTYLLLALLPITVGMINAFFVLKENPSAIGQEPYHVKYGKTTAQDNAKLTTEGIRQRDALRSLSCVLLILAITLWSAVATINPYLASYAATSAASETAGFDLKGFIGTAVAIGNILGAFFIGLANDYFGAKGGVIVGCACGMAGAITLLFGDSSAVAILIGSSCIGVYISLYNVQIPIMVRDMYGGLDYDKLFPLFIFFSGCFGSGSASLWGRLYDIAGNYSLMLSIAAFAAVIAGVAGVLAVWRSKALGTIKG